MNYAYFPILISEKYRMSRDELYDKLKNHNIYSRKYFYPSTPDQYFFGDRYKGIDIACARRLSDQVLTLPIYEDLENEVIDRIAGLLGEK